jgi:hypothetical protein
MSFEDLEARFSSQPENSVQYLADLNREPNNMQQEVGDFNVL